jgi:hypothetical protein
LGRKEGWKITITKKYRLGAENDAWTLCQIPNLGHKYGNS